MLGAASNSIIYFFFVFLDSVRLEFQKDSGRKKDLEMTNQQPNNYIMKPPFYRFLLICWLCAAADVSAADGLTLERQLEPLRPFLDKTWKGAFKNSTPEKPMVDIMRWERALNGKAVRVLHSVNDGTYGGETIFMWDPKKQVIKCPPKDGQCFRDPLDTRNHGVYRGVIDDVGTHFGGGGDVIVIFRFIAKPIRGRVAMTSGLRGGRFSSET